MLAACRRGLVSRSGPVTRCRCEPHTEQQQQDNGVATRGLAQNGLAAQVLSRLPPTEINLRACPQSQPAPRDSLARRAPRSVRKVGPHCTQPLLLLTEYYCKQCRSVSPEKESCHGTQTMQFCHIADQALGLGRWVVRKQDAETACGCQRDLSEAILGNCLPWHMQYLG